MLSLSVRVALETRPQHFADHFLDSQLQPQVVPFGTCIVDESPYFREVIRHKINYIKFNSSNAWPKRMI